MTDAIIGRSAIAEALNRSEKTVSRWAASGALRVWHAGPYPNSPLIARAEDVARLKKQFEDGE